jgi:hypothetical protein
LTAQHIVALKPGQAVTRLFLLRGRTTLKPERWVRYEGRKIFLRLDDGRPDTAPEVQTRQRRGVVSPAFFVRSIFG